MTGLRLLVRTAVWLIAVCVVANAAQGTTGRVAGAVSDSAGARVPGASVAVESAETALRRRVVADRNGQFAVELLPPGRYRVTVSADGFRTVTFDAVAVTITDTTRLDAALDAALGAESVTITWTPSLLQTESSKLGRVVNEHTLRELPLPTRNFLQLLALSPGTSAGLANTTEFGRGDAAIFVNGQRATSNNVRINGVDANAIGANSTQNVAVPAIDAIEEFIVQTSLYDASQGRNAGGAIVAVTKSGSNEFHGGAYEFFRDNVLNANGFFLNEAGQPRPVLDRSQFGGVLGGPIVRDKAFFFGSYQGTRERNGASLTNSLTFPTIPVGLRDDNRSATGLAAAFGVPAASIDPISVAILNARLPNGAYAVASPTTATGLTPSSGVSTFDENQYNANVDLVLSDRHTVSGKWFSASNPTDQAVFFQVGLGNGPTQLPGFGAHIEAGNRVLSLTDTIVIGSNVVNQARVGYNRIRVAGVPEEPLSASELGISSPLGSAFPGMPTIQVTGLFTLGSSAFADSSARTNAITAGDTVSFALGRHRIRTGGEVRRSQLNNTFRAFTRGQLVFPTFAAFLAGQSISLIGSGVFDKDLRTLDVGAFVQDDWKASDRLTINLGVRYDVYGNATEVRGRLVNLLRDQLVLGTPGAPAFPPNGFVQAGNATDPLAGVPLVDDGLVPSDRNNVAPRIGFAYVPFDTTRVVVRGGYGVYFDRPSTRYAGLQLFTFPYYAIATAVGRPLSAPFAAVPEPAAFPLAAAIPSPTLVPISGIFVDPNLRTPYVQQFGANVQWEVANDIVIEAGYVGAKGTKLLQIISLSQPAYDRAAGAFVAPLGPSFSQQKAPAFGVHQVQSGANSIYHAFQLSATKRFARGLEFLAAYTLGKSVDTYSGSASTELVAVPGDQTNLRLGRARSDFDRRHRLVVSFVYELPRYDAGPRAARALLTGWQVSGIATLQSGLPFSVVDNPNNFTIQRANVAPGATGNGALGGDVTSRLDRYFDTSAYVPSRQFLAPGVVNPFFDPNAPFGSSPRNTLTGPAQQGLDVAIVKTIPVGEQARLALRTELFNALNAVNFANPNANVAVPSTFGRITSTSAGPRVIQFAAKLNF